MHLIFRFMPAKAIKCSTMGLGVKISARLSGFGVDAEAVIGRTSRGGLESPLLRSHLHEPGVSVRQR